MTGTLRYLIVRFDCSKSLPMAEFLKRDDALFSTCEWSWTRVHGEAFVFESESQTAAEQFAQKHVGKEMVIGSDHELGPEEAK